VPGYVEHAQTAIKEMYRQVGNLVLNDEGLAEKGVIVRHLILPEGLAGSVDSLRWLAREVSPEITVSIMAQYYPTHKAAKYPELARGINAAEYQEVVDLLKKYGLEKGWVQEMDAPTNYRPDFKSEGHPFEKGG
jgi:putative pyruvate formate lyase activating enzyme